MQSFNDSDLVAGRLGYMTQKNLEGMAYWVMDCIRRNMALIAADWSANALKEAKEANDCYQKEGQPPDT